MAVAVGSAWPAAAATISSTMTRRRLVVGAFGDFDFMHLHGTFGDRFNSGVVADENESWAWAAGGRIGFLVAPTVLTYFNGGYTQTRLRSDEFLVLGRSNLRHSRCPPGTDLSAAGSSAAEPNIALTIASDPGFLLAQRIPLLELSESGSSVPVSSAGSAGSACAQHMRNQVQTLATELVYKLNWTALISSTFAILAPGDRAKRAHPASGRSNKSAEPLKRPAA